MLTSPLQDALKPTLRRDWNCPWVKRDGRGLKKVMKAFGVEAPAVHPVATSKQHFYRSEKLYTINKSSSANELNLRYW